MLIDPSWLSEQAQTLHGIFNGLFYAVITVLLLLGVFVEYIKWPLGGVPSFAVLVGRALVAAILLYTYADVTNLLADVTDSLASQLGDLNQFKLVLTKMGEKLNEASLSWVSVKETLTVALSFLGFFLLYFSVYVAEGVYLFTWTLCYVFSPILIAFYVLPGLAGSTKALYRTLFEVASWKIVWSCLATLLWSMATSDINRQDVNFIAIICMNLLLASSVLATPLVVRAMATTGLSGFTQTVGAVAVGAVTVSPRRVASAARSGVSNGIDRVRMAAGKSKSSNFQRNSSKSTTPSEGDT